MAIVDACQSGALARTTGVIAKAAVPIEMRGELDAVGQAFLASTSQGESDLLSTDDGTLHYAIGDTIVSYHYGN